MSESNFSQITTYSKLVEEITGYINRNDEDTLSRIPVFINNAEKSMARIIRMPSLEKMVRFDSTDSNIGDLTDDGYFAIPTDYLEMKSFWATSETCRQSLERVSIDQILEYSETPGMPAVFARTGSIMHIRPIPEEGITFSMVYYQDTPETEEGADSIWYVLAHDILLYLSVAEAFDYIYETEKASYWRNRSNERIAELTAMVNEAEWSGSNKRMGGSNAAQLNQGHSFRGGY